MVEPPARETRGPERLLLELVKKSPSEMYDPAGRLSLSGRHRRKRPESIEKIGRESRSRPTETWSRRPRKASQRATRGRADFTASAALEDAFPKTVSYSVPCGRSVPA